MEEFNLNIIKPDHWGYVTQLIRQNPNYLEFLNEINARFDKPIFLDDKDWLQQIFSTLFNFTWQSEDDSGIIISHHAFSEPNLTRGEGKEKLRVYFYILPEIKSDKLKESFEISLGKLFPEYSKIEGVQIYGINSPKAPIKTDSKSTSKTKPNIITESSS